MIETPAIFLTEASYYAGLHLVIPTSQIQKAMGPGIAEIVAALRSQGVSPSGPMFTHHFHRPVKTFDFEICIPVGEPIHAEGRILPQVWPRMKVARTVHHGDYSGLPGAWGEFERWVSANSRHPGSEFWEVYLSGPNESPDPAAWRTELNWPLMD